MALQQKTSWLPVAVLTSSLLVLTACGGGSSSSDNTGNGGGNTTNTAPTTSNVSASTKEDTSQSITLVGSDANSDPLTYSMVSQPTHGTVSISGSSATYTPSTDFNGTDSFTYKANDGALNSNTATVNLSITAVNDAPVANPATASVTAGVSKKITLSGTDVDSKTLTASISTQPQHGSVSVNGLIATYTANANHSGTDTFAYTLSDGSATSNPASVTITVNANNTDILHPTPTGKWNDTGITDCGNYPFTSAGKANGHLTTSNENCALTTTAQGDAIPQEQDGQTGRDATNNDDSDGVAGFSFTKIGDDGKALAIQDQQWSYNAKGEDNGSEAAGTKWSCVKDNVTGLIWEVKTQDGGLRDMDWQYTWYNTDNTTNGGGVGVQDGGHCQGSQCDTQSYVEAVNAQGLCGSSHWRLPEVDELQSIVDHTKHDPEPTIDINFFPNTKAWIYWSATPYAKAFDYAWFIGFNGGNDNWSAGKGYDNASVRLVRSN
ncbi:MAG: hypothetical protein RI964_619 [Pseudomonadota bacterium]|jgi:hypothetical protein